MRVPGSFCALLGAWPVFGRRGWELQRLVAVVRGIVYGRVGDRVIRLTSKTVPNPVAGVAGIVYDGRPLLRCALFTPRAWTIVSAACLTTYRVEHWICSAGALLAFLILTFPRSPSLAHFHPSCRSSPLRSDFTHLRCHHTPQHSRVKAQHSISRDIFNMPVDWKALDSADRLLAAVIASVDGQKV